MSISLTINICIITSLISVQAFTNQKMQNHLLFHPVTVKNEGQYYRFLTHALVHADWGHLFINMYVLYTFGEYIEVSFITIFGKGMGKILFIALYLGSVLLGSTPAYLKHQNHSYYRSLGASGGTSGIVFAFVIFNPWQWFIFPPLPAILFAVAFLWYSSYLDKKGGDNVAHDAHIWGAVFGFVFTIGAIYTLRPDYIPYFIDNFNNGLPWR